MGRLRSTDNSKFMEKKDYDTSYGALVHLQKMFGDVGSGCWHQDLNTGFKGRESKVHKLRAALFWGAAPTSRPLTSLERGRCV